MSTDTAADNHPDGRVRRGNATRRHVLRHAVDVASVEGLDGLSIGRLATELKMSKSGLFALFGAKEQLQLATIRAARRIFSDAVVEPAQAAPAGLERSWALIDRWLDYSSGRVFPGGCFFARTSHEYAARPGEIHDALAAARSEWLGLIEESLAEAKAAGHLDPDEDLTQLTVEIASFLEGANLDSQFGDTAAYDRARTAAHARLSRASRDDALRPAVSESPAR